MNFSMEHKTYRGKDCIRFRAKIVKSEKHGIPNTCQKTWRILCDDPMYSDKEIRKIGLAQAKRWQRKLLLRWFGSEEKIPKQMEIIHEHDEASEQGEPMPGLSEDGLVFSGEVAGDVHESPVQPAQDAGGQQHGVAAPTEGGLGVQATGSEIRAAPADGEHHGTDAHLPKADDPILPEGSGEQPECK